VDSFDLNRRPLSFSWVVLRGDNNKIAINPRNKDKSIAEIIVPYHSRRPIAPGSSLESNRVDIGVFVHNGIHYSAPGFVTFFTLDNEARTYDRQGRIVEIGYDMGQTRLGVTGWLGFLEAFSEQTPGMKCLPASRETRQLFSSSAARFAELQKTGSA